MSDAHQKDATSSLFADDKGTEGSHALPTTPMQGLMSDFEHLGLVVKADDDDKTAKVDVGADDVKQRSASKYAAPTMSKEHDQTSHGHKDAEPPNEPRAVADDSTSTPAEKTTVNTRVARPVTHETIRVQEHEIQERVVHRDIHEYHEVTRIQPIIEKVVLPARHFIETADGRKTEIPPPVPVHAENEHTGAKPKSSLHAQ